MTRTPSTDEGNRDLAAADEGNRNLAATDETSGRSFGGMLAVIRDRPSILVGLVVALLGQTAVTAVLYPVVASLEAWLLILVGPALIATAVLAGFVVWVERRPLASIGTAWPTWSDVRIGIGGAAVGLPTMLVTVPLVDALGFGASERGALEMILQFPTWAVILAVIVVSVTEEVLFRAYPIERLAEITGRVRVAAAFSLVAFVLLHVPLWGVGHVITIGGISIVLTVLYAWRRRLAPVVVMHFLTNLVLLVVLPALGWL